MTTWSRRSFVRGIGVAALASACKRATPTTQGEAHTEPIGDPLQPAYAPYGRSPIVIDGDGWVEVRENTVIRRDATLAETARIAVNGARSVAPLGDGSLVVCANDATLHRVDHIVNNAIATSHPSTGDSVLPAESPAMFWSVGSRWIDRVAIASGTTELQLHLPENSYPDTAASTSDHRVVIAHLSGVLRADRALSTFAWTRSISHLGPGPDADSVWASVERRNETPEVILLKLTATEASPIAHHPLGANEHFVHFSGHGAFAAAITARTDGSKRAAFSLVVFDAKGERWRASLGEEHAGFYTALSATRAITLAKPSDALRMWDLDAGTEITRSP